VIGATVTPGRSIYASSEQEARMSDWALGVHADTVSAGLLIGRLVVGLGMAAHGSQKLFGWFGGKGLPGTTAYVESLGFRPGRPFAILAGLGEFTSGLLVALGFLGPVGPALMMAVMSVAAVQSWNKGFFAMNGGFEVPLLYASAALALSFIGPGRFSLDAALGIAPWSNLRLVAVAVGVAVVGAVGSLAVRHPAPAAR
jgi:putative oxidoreductase